MMLLQKARFGVAGEIDVFIAIIVLSHPIIDEKW